jgi:hypothetical protein
MPRPFPGAAAAALAATHDEYWSELNFAPVAEITPNIDADNNPWTRRGPVPTPPIEYVGRTGPGGSLHAVSGLFNLRDPRRFARAIVPDALTLGFVIVADGYQPATTERRFRAGGTYDSRTLRLLESGGHGLYTSNEWVLAQRGTDVLALEGLPGIEPLEEPIAKLLDRTTDALVAIPFDRRDGFRRDAEARLWLRLARRAPAALQEPLARRALELDPASVATLHRIAARLAADAGLWPGAPLPKTPTDPTDALVEAERLLDECVRLYPRFFPPYPLLDALLARRGASDADRRSRVVKLFKENPFDAWARARLATFDLRAGRAADAFDHLRFTYMTVPGLGGDRELALALSAHYWKIGLPEKAGAYAWLLTGRVPEDPFAPPRSTAR